MVSKGEDKFIIWPIYFDKTVSRLQGRKVPKKLAVEKPVLEDIVKAVKSLGLNPQLEKSARHPKHHWKQGGRILINQKDTKTKLLKQIASRL